MPNVLNKTETNIEIIQTGLTRNYVSYWTEKQAIKEALQNIAYGVLKSGEAFQANWRNGIGVIEDSYTGFGKNMLYIGESGQREDEDGLGNFGEGWKIFLLAMARNNRTHIVHTVGFSFYGRMVETPHGTEVLNIYVQSNIRERGTRVEMECTEKDFNQALESFAILQNIPMEYIQKESVIPGEKHELWVNGVRIEQDENTNPLELYYSYNVKDRSLMNRDRSQVNSLRALQHIQIIMAKEVKTREQIRELIDVAMNPTNSKYKDIERGPSSYSWSDSKEIWKEEIAKAHGTTWDKLVIPVMAGEYNREAEYRGYTLCMLPMRWHSELEWIGMKTVSKVLEEKPIMEIIDLNFGQKKMLHSAKLQVKRCLKLVSVNELPEIDVTSKIETGGDNKVLGLYNRVEKKVYLLDEVFESQRQLTKTLLHECVHWKTDYADNTAEFTNEFEQIIMDLLGL